MIFLGSVKGVSVTGPFYIVWFSEGRLICDFECFNVLSLCSESYHLWPQNVAHK